MWMLLHGFTGAPRSWDAALASANLEEEPLRPSLSGHGESWKERASGTFAGEVERLAKVASEMSSPRFLGGYSLGARLAFGLLATYPRLFDGALLIGLHPGLADEASRQSRRVLDQERASVLRHQGLHAFLDSWEKLPLFETQRTLPEDIMSSQRRIRTDHESEGLAHSLDVLGLGSMPSYRSTAWSGHTPITLMSGALDTKFRDIARTLDEETPEIEAVIVERAGHNLLLEAAPQVAREMRRLEARAMERPIA